MGNCISVCKRKREPSKPITLAIIGLDDAGKTTLCSVLANEQPDLDVAPTVGFRSVKFTWSNFDVTLFDVGGGKNIRPIWKTYYGEIFAVIYVVDSSSRARLAEARDAFRESFEHPQLSGKPVLVLANKSDKDDHLLESDITHGLRLEETANVSNCPSKLVLVSATAGWGSKMDHGIATGLDWLMEQVRILLPSLEPRVEEDVRQAKEAQDREREERRARVKKQREERERAEEMERTRLGIEKRPESDEDDVPDGGNPFRVLDLDQLKKKEQRMKADKKERQQRLRDLGYDEDSIGGVRYKRTGYDNNNDDEDDNNGDAMRFRMDGKDSLGLFGRNTRGSALPPLEPLGSSALDGSDKKQQKKKKKRLTEYHMPDSPQRTRSATDVNDFHGTNNGSASRFGLSIPPHLGLDSEAHDLTPRNTKYGGQQRPIQAGRHSRVLDEDEDDEGDEVILGRGAGLYVTGSSISPRPHYRDNGDSHVSKSMPSAQELKRSKLREAEGFDLGDRVGRSTAGVKKMNGLEKYPREGQQRLHYRNSLTEISPPNLRPFEEEDEGIEQDEEDKENNNLSDDDDDAAELERFRANRRAHKARSAGVRREAMSATGRHGNQTNNRFSSYDDDARVVPSKNRRSHHDDSDNDEEAQEEYGTYNPLKDTLRFTFDETRNFEEEMEELRRRARHKKHGGYDNDGYDASPTKPRQKFRDDRDSVANGYRDEDNSYRGRREINHRDVRSPDDSDNGRERQTDQRKKKKRNLLRSNKLAPRDNDDDEDTVRPKFASPRLVQEHGSRNNSDNEMSSKNRNSRLTQFHRNDSDFNSKWGLAEDLPSIDDSLRRRRVPNYGDSEDEDVVF